MSDPAAACPFCGSRDLEVVGAWGGQLITSQARCRTCNTYFEAIRDVSQRPAAEPFSDEPDRARRDSR